MGTISLSLPVLNSPDTTEDVKVLNNFTVLQTLLNGNVDTNNLSASAAILRSQLAAGTGFVKMNGKNANYTAVDGDMVMAFAPPMTVTLPAPTAGYTIGIWSENNTGGTPVTVAAAGGASVIRGVGSIGVSSILLGTPGSFVVLSADGGNWYVIAGQQDTGWVPLALGTNVIADSTYYTPAARVQGDTLELCGALKNNGTSISPGTTLATVPSGLRPAKQSSPPGGPTGADGYARVLVQTSGIVLLTESWPGGDDIYLDGASCRFI